jgi:hypothetical protein
VGSAGVADLGGASAQVGTGPGGVVVRGDSGTAGGAAAAGGIGAAGSGL